MHCNQAFKMMYKFAVILYMCTGPKYHSHYEIFYCLVKEFPPSFVIQSMCDIV